MFLKRILVGIMLVSSILVAEGCQQSNSSTSFTPKAQLTASPDSVDILRNNTIDITLTNTFSISASGVTLNTEALPDGVLLTNDCGSSLAAGANCLIHLSSTSNAVGSGDFSISGTNFTTLTVEVSVAALSATVTPNPSLTTQLVTLTNPSDINLTLATIAISGDASVTNTSPDSGVYCQTGQTLAANESCEIQLTGSNATTLSEETGTLTVTYSGTDNINPATLTANLAVDTNLYAAGAQTGNVSRYDGAIFSLVGASTIPDFGGEADDLVLNASGQLCAIGSNAVQACFDRQSWVDQKTIGDGFIPVAGSMILNADNQICIAGSTNGLAQVYCNNVLQGSTFPAGYVVFSLTTDQNGALFAGMNIVAHFVQQFSNGIWQPNQPGYNNSSYTAINKNNSGHVITAGNDFDTGQAIVQEFNGTSWVTLLNVIAGYANPTALAQSTNNTYYIAAITSPFNQKTGALFHQNGSVAVAITDSTFTGDDDNAGIISNHGMVVNNFNSDTSADDIYFGGAFTSVNGDSSISYIAKYNASTDDMESLGTGVDGKINSLLIVPTLTVGIPQ